MKTTSILILLILILTTVGEAQTTEEELQRLTEKTEAQNLMEKIEPLHTEDKLLQLMRYQVQLMKYQAKKKSPGLATLIAISTPLPGLAHKYAGNSSRATHFGLFYTGGVTMIILGVADRNTSFYGKDDITETGKVLIAAGGFIVVFTKIIEAFNAYTTAVEYNQELQKKLGLDLSSNLSLNSTQNSLSVALRF